MSLVQVYPQSIGRKRIARRIRLIKTVLLTSVMMVFIPLISNAIPTNPPTALFGVFQSRTVCGNLPTDVGDWLRVQDIDLGETLTWTITSFPFAGSLSGDGATAAAGGSSAMPTGMVYTADPGATADFFRVKVTDDSGFFVEIDVTLSINAGPSLVLGAMPAVCAGVTSTSITFSDLQNVGPDTVVFNTVGTHSWTVPTNVTGVMFDVMGAGGGNENITSSSVPGKGGRVQGILSVAPNSVMNIFVGGRGEDGTSLGASGGFNGGGNAYFYNFGCGGAGGGASDIRIGGTGLINRKVVAGGGGGAGSDGPPDFSTLRGGAGGGLTGGNSDFNGDSYSTSRGGTQIAGGAPSTWLVGTPGGFGTSGAGGDGSNDQGISGGGGGGYFGGGGGIWTGGGGGSSFTDNITAYSVTHTQGANDGDGMVALYYVNPGTYTIIWDDIADTTGGFENVASAELPSNFIFPIAVPFSAPPGTYNGTLVIRNINCESVQYPISVTVKPLPTVDAVPDQVLCHGGTTSSVYFSGPISGTAFNWMNDNPAIGIPASDADSILSFMPINTTPLPVSANITVTPVADGCIGDPMVFQIVDNPIPMLNGTTTPPSICNNSLFSYSPTSLTPGTTFEWSRALVPGISNTASTGTGNPSEILMNTTDNPIAVTYSYTLTANSCTNVQDVVVMVNPTPVLSTSLTATPLCNNAVFNYVPNTTTIGAVITWERDVVPGISNLPATGTGSISETLLNTTIAPINVTYAVTLTIDGCSNTQNVVVTVNPPLTLTSPTALPPMCSGNTMLYGPVSSVPSATKTWSRAAVTGITPATSTGSNNISEVLNNTTPLQVEVTYVYTLSAYGCTNTQSVTRTVNPRARLSSPLMAEAICTNTFFTYSPASLTPGATFQWARDNQPGIANPATPVMTGSVSEILVNFTDTAINVLYKYTTTAYGCANADSVLVRVNPTPRIINDTTTLAICDSTLVNFTPVSATPGATYAWHRDYEPGIANPQNSGTSGNPNERLNNNTYISVPATYVYTITANGCTNTQNVIVLVRPSPILTHDTGITCSGAPFRFEPISYTTLTTFAWTRTATANITPATASGTGDVMDTLTSTSSTPLIVKYNYDLTIFGCVNKQTVTVTVNPAPTAAIIGTHPSDSICNSTMYMNFGAAAPAPDGYTYIWSATNATVHATGDGKQYALVNFSTPGKATVTLTIKNSTTGCTNNTNRTVTVGDSQPEYVEVIYFDRQFICKQNQQTSYQWGYDDKSTMDSTMLAGETNQNYFNENPDFGKRSYWVITTTQNGCQKKTYFNPPTGVDDVNIGDVSMKLFPNPTSSFVNIEVNQLVSGDVKFDVFNLMGQRLQTVPAVGNKAQINVADLPAGAYIIDCTSDGIKVAAARFIKN